MKYIVLLWLCLIAPAMAETTFISLMPDIPLMEGTIEIEQDALIYSKAQGRIVQVMVDLTGTTPDALKAFYAETLPQLGWITEQNGTTYKRDGERLFLDFNDYASENIVKIMIQPD